MSMPLLRIMACAGPLLSGLVAFAATDAQRPNEQRAPALLQVRLRALLTHSVVMSPGEIVAAIREGLASSEERELALATLQARIAVPQMDPAAADQATARAAWTAELHALSALRPQLEPLLNDSSADTRGRVVAMLVALQVDPTKLMPVLDSATERLLLDQFARDPSESVRGRIIRVLRDVSPPLSTEARSLLEKARSDPADSIRAAALHASVAHSTETEAASLLMQMISDRDRQVRVEVALQLLRFQHALAPHMGTEDSIRERD